MVEPVCTGKCRKFAIDPCCPVHGIGSSRYVLNLVGMVAVVFVVALCLAVTPPADGKNGRPKFISPFAWAVAMCETQGNFNHDGGSYEGAWGWYVGTWQLDKRAGYPSSPTDATPREQNRVFADSLRKGRYFGCIVNGGYRSHL